MGTWTALDAYALKARKRHRKRRLPLRPCLCEGCPRVFRARRGNQRYCQDPDCLREARRWHAAKRQQRHRMHPDRRRAHADAERLRRRNGNRRGAAKPGQARATTKRGAAWSRRRKKSEPPLCDRPGCWETPQDVGGQRAHYCGPECRQAMRRVLDRERKARRRKVFEGRFKRQIQYHGAWIQPESFARDSERSREPLGPVPAVAGSGFGPTPSTRPRIGPTIGLNRHEREPHGPETTADSRAPPRVAP